VNWRIGGTTEEMLSSLRSLVLILGIAIFLVYTVMVIQFEHFAQPLPAILILKIMINWRNGSGHHKAAARQFAEGRG
jgi:multidrug efflux pump subunit AcrB